MRFSGVLGAHGPSAVRMGAALAVGLAAGAGVGAAAGWQYAPAAGWFAAAGSFVLSTWLVLRHLDGARTAAHATRDDPTRRVTDVVLLLASIASLAGVAYLLVGSSSQDSGGSVAAIVGVASVAGSWLLVHTVFTLRYARLYYTSQPPGGVDFNQDQPPTYTEFAYLAFTLGMTYQVSDTDLTTRPVRATALHQGLLSYLLGAVVLAVVINLVAGLGGGH